MKTRFYKAALPVLPFIISVSPVLFAQSGNDAIETMVVTASRTPVPLSQVAGSSTIIDQDELQRRQSAPLATILRDVPGFAVSRGGVLGSTTQIRVRGAEANQLLVMIDGIEANDLSQGSEFNFAHLLNTEIERVEILRGPQSALWGSDATAGVVNIITRRGEGGPSVSGFLEGGSFDTVYGGGRVSAGGDRYHFNAGGSVLDAGGSNISRQGNEDDGYDNITLSFKAGYEPTDYLSFEAIGRHVEATNEFDDIDFLTGLPADADNESDSMRDYGRARARLSLFDGRWEHKLGGGATITENDNFSAGVETSSTQGRRYELDYQTSVFFQVPSLDNSEHALTFAFDYENEDFTQRGQVSPFGDPNQEQSIDSTGFVGEYRAAAGEDWSFSASVRHDDNSDFENDTTWRFTGGYRLESTGTRLRAAYGTGSKNPTFTERFGFFAQSLTPFVGNPELKPEHSEGWEAGFDQLLWDGRAELAFTYFDEDLEDEINGFVFDPALGGFTALNTDGVSKRQGAEVTGRVQISPALSLKGMYTWLNATQPDPAFGQVREIRRPKHTAGVNLNYTFAKGRGNINLNVHYNGEQFDTFFPPFPNPPQRVTLDDFTLVNLAASWQLTDHINLYGRIENLLDEDYEEVFGFATPGIGAYAGLRVSLQP